MQKKLIIVFALLAVSLTARHVNPERERRVKEAVAMQKEINSKYELNLKRASSGSKKQGFIDTGFDCIRGAAYGLQYDPAQTSSCYTALS